MVCVNAPLVPEIVTVDVPAGVDAEVVTVIVDDVVAGFGENVAAAPAGKPVAVSVTEPLNPFEPAIATV